LFDSIPGTRSKAAAQFFSRLPRAAMPSTYHAAEGAPSTRANSRVSIERAAAYLRIPAEFPRNHRREVPEREQGHARARARLAFNLFIYTRDSRTPQ
jgi:hypothetical protein